MYHNCAINKTYMPDLWRMFNVISCFMYVCHQITHYQAGTLFFDVDSTSIFSSFLIFQHFFNIKEKTIEKSTSNQSQNINVDTSMHFNVFSTSKKHQNDVEVSMLIFQRFPRSKKRWQVRILWHLFFKALLMLKKCWNFNMEKTLKFWVRKHQKFVEALKKCWKINVKKTLTNKHQTSLYVLQHFFDCRYQSFPLGNIEYYFYQRSSTLLHCHCTGYIQK